MDHYTTFYICVKACGRLFKTEVEKDIHQNRCDGSFISYEELLNTLLKSENN